MTTILEGIELPDGLTWTDEFTSSKVAQTAKRTLGGTLVIYHSPLLGGMPITLESASDMGWASKSTVDQLLPLANSPGAVYSLSIRGVTYSVMFRHQDGNALEATPVISGGVQTLNSYFQLKLLLMTV